MTAPSAVPSIANIASRLAPFAAQLKPEQLQAIQTYITLLLQWNQKVSLTSIEDPLEIVSRHFGESIFAATPIISSICRLADVGSGAGFPGLPLKIVLPQSTVILIEPNLKKCAFLTEVITVLELKDIEVFKGQYSAFRVSADENRLGFDLICSRALGDYKNLLQWAKRTLKSDGKAALWLGDEDALSLSRLKGWAWDPPIRIPESQRRAIVVGRPSVAPLP